MITFNNPEDTQRRQNVKPLSEQEIEALVSHINTIFPYQQSVTERLQRLLDYYQNLQHFYSVAGGWNGLPELQNPWIKISDAFPDSLERPIGVNGISDDVLVLLDGKVQTGVYSHNTEKWTVAGHGDHQQPTHWRPMVELPLDVQRD